MWTTPVSESAELTQWALYIIVINLRCFSTGHSIPLFVDFYWEWQIMCEQKSLSVRKEIYIFDLMSLLWGQSCTD